MIHYAVIGIENPTQKRKKTKQNKKTKIVLKNLKNETDFLELLSGTFKWNLNPTRHLLV